MFCIFIHAKSTKGRIFPFSGHLFTHHKISKFTRSVPHIPLLQHDMRSNIEKIPMKGDYLSEKMKNNSEGIFLYVLGIKVTGT